MRDVVVFDQRRHQLDELEDTDAFQTTFQIADVLTPWLPQPYSTDLGHSLGHAGLDVGPSGAEPDRLEDWRATILANRAWRMEMFARLLDGLKSTPEGDGTMLDNSVVLFTSEFGCGGAHSPRDVPVLLAGKAGGRWPGGRSPARY